VNPCAREDQYFPVSYYAPDALLTINSGKSIVSDREKKTNTKKGKKFIAV
jgi:hypothetical protein